MHGGNTMYAHWYHCTSARRGEQPSYRSCCNSGASTTYAATEPVHGLSQVIETQHTLWVQGGREPGDGGAAHGHPVCHAAYSVDVESLRQTLVEVAGRRGRNTLP